MVDKIVSSLHLLERKVFPLLDKHKSVEEIKRASGLKEVEIVRALQWLENKELVRVSAETEEIISLSENGLIYKEKGLPERIFLNIINKEKQLPLSALKKKTGLSSEELNVSFGILRNNAAVIVSKDKDINVKITDKGKQLAKTVLSEEEFLKSSFPLRLNEFSADDKKVFEKLKKRKDIIKIEREKSIIISLTALGKKVLAKGILEEKVMDRITPLLIRTEGWKNKKFRRYDVLVQVPKIHGGKLHPYRRFLDNVRKDFMRLGFKEMTGPLVETDFWDMDALFMPQFHSARDIHEAYYVKEPQYGIIDKKFLKRVKAAHENGGKTGSTGWQYQFDKQRTRRLLLRTQGTACSARMLASEELEIPGKYFGITRCFRYDVIDATHLPDFNQVEGIVVEEGLTLRHLFGLLKMFARVFANTEEIKIVPGYFPFTEPSAELFARHPELGWIELGGAGIFRPEVVMPLLGKDVPVIAWGLGIDRIGMFNLGLKDIRDLFSQNLNLLRGAK